MLKIVAHHDLFDFGPPNRGHGIAYDPFTFFLVFDVGGQRKALFQCEAVTRKCFRNADFASALASYQGDLATGKSSYGHAVCEEHAPCDTGADQGAKPQAHEH